MPRGCQKFIPPIRSSQVPVTPRTPRFQLYTDNESETGLITPVHVPETCRKVKCRVVKRKTRERENTTAVCNIQNPKPTTSDIPLENTTSAKTCGIRNRSAKVNPERADTEVTNLPAIHLHLDKNTTQTNECLSIFNFTQSPPPKRKTLSSTERKKITLDVLLSIYKMKNQLEILRERRYALAVKRSKEQHGHVIEEEE